MRMSLEELKKLWNEFEDVPIDEDEYIDEDFYIWEKGNDRYHIWHWFDDRLPNGLAKDLMAYNRIYNGKDNNDIRSVERCNLTRA